MSCCGKGRAESSIGMQLGVEGGVIIDPPIVLPIKKAPGLGTAEGVSPVVIGLGALALAVIGYAIVRRK